MSAAREEPLTLAFRAAPPSSCHLPFLPALGPPRSVTHTHTPGWRPCAASSPTGNLTVAGQALAPANSPAPASRTPPPARVLPVFSLDCRKVTPDPAAAELSPPRTPHPGETPLFYSLPHTYPFSKDVSPRCCPPRKVRELGSVSPFHLPLVLGRAQTCTSPQGELIWVQSACHSRQPGEWSPRQVREGILLGELGVLPPTWTRG